MKRGLAPRPRPLLCTALAGLQAPRTPLCTHDNALSRPTHPQPLRTNTAALPCPALRRYGLIRDAPFFEWLEANVDKLLARDPEAIAYAVQRSCINKAEVVAADERETNDVRATLNLGHTFGHAIETGTGYGTFLHGEAVSIGMVMAADMSYRLVGLGRSPGGQAVGLRVLPRTAAEGLRAICGYCFCVPGAGGRNLLDSGCSWLLVARGCPGVGGPRVHMHQACTQGCSSAAGLTSS